MNKNEWWAMSTKTAHGWLGEIAQRLINSG